MGRTRNAFQRSEETGMWTFLYWELRRANTAAYEPKGKRIWKDYVLKHGSNRTDGSLSTHFRRHMYNRLYDANLDRKSMMFLYGCLKIPITDDIRKILELKFQISIVVNKSGLLRNYTTIDPNCNDADDDCEIIDGFEDDSDDSSTYQFPRSHSPCNVSPNSSLSRGESTRSRANVVVSEDSMDFTRDIKETLAGCRVRDRGLTNVDLTECSQGEGTSILPRFTRSSTYKTLLHEDDECQLIDDKNINSIRQESICKDDRTSISSVIVQLEDRDEQPSHALPKHTVLDSQDFNSPHAINKNPVDIEPCSIKEESINRFIRKSTTLEHPRKLDRSNTGECGKRIGNSREYNPESDTYTSRAFCSTLSKAAIIDRSNGDCSNSICQNKPWHSMKMNTFRQLWRRSVLDRLATYNIDDKSVIISEIDKEEEIAYRESESKFAYKCFVRAMTKKIFDELKDLELYYKVPDTVRQPFIRGDPNLVITLQPVKGVSGYSVPINIRVYTIKGIICMLIHTHPASVANLCLASVQLEALNAKCAVSEEDYRNRMVEVKEIVKKLC